MKILYSCPLDPVKLAAPGQHVASVVKEFIKLKYEVQLIHQGKILDSVDESVQIALDLNRKSLFGRLGSDIRYALALCRYLKQSKCQGVYHRMEKWSVLPVLVFRWFNIHSVMEVNADNRSELASMNANPLTKICYSLSEWLQVRMVNKIVVVSEGIGKNLSRNFTNIGDKIQVVENGADLDNYFPRDRQKSCEELGIDTELKYVVFSGSFQKWQGLETLVASAVLVSREFDDVSFILVGDGRMRQELELMIQRESLESIFLLPGWQTPDKVAMYLSVADICVAPYSTLAALEGEPVDASFSEILMKCSPLKIYTYMAMAKPIVASGFLDGGARLEKWGAGLAFEPGNERELADALLKLLRDSSLGNELGRKGLEQVRKHHTWSTVGKKLSTILTVRSD